MDHLKGTERQKHIVGAASGAMMAEVVSEYMMGAAIRRMEEKLNSSGHAPSSQAYADLRRSLLADEFKTIRTVAQLSVVAPAESLKVDLNAAMAAANNALDKNSAEVFFELAQQSGSGSYHQDDDGNDTDDEADQQAYGRYRKKLIGAVQPEVVEKYGQAAAEYAHHLSLGPDGYAQAMLEKNTDGRELSPEVREILLDTYQGHYFDMLHAFNVMQGMGKIGDTAGEATEYILRKAGVNRATARNIHRAINDGATVFGIGGAVKGAAKFGARTASKAGKGTTRISLDGLGLEKPKMIKHHVFNVFRGDSPKSQAYRDFFKKHKIDIDRYTLEIPETYHRNVVHLSGNNWTTRWKNWIDKNPNATTKEVYQFAGVLLDEYNLQHVPITPYRGKK